MNRRLRALVKDLKPDYDGNIYEIDSGCVKKIVNDRLNSVPSERKVYMRQKFLKSAALVCAVIAATATSVFAMSNIDLLRQFFEGDTKKLEQYVEMPKYTVSDNNYCVTLDKIISTEYSAKVIISVRGLSKAAAAEIADGKMELIRDTYVNYVENSENHYIGSWGGRELTEYRTEDTSFWEMSISAENSVSKGEKIRLWFDFLDTENNYIDTELKTDIDTVQYTLKGQPYCPASINLNPMEIILYKAFPDSEEPDIYNTGVYFRMTDGKTKTFNQLFDVSTMSLVKEHMGYNVYSFTADAYKILDLSQFKSVILNGLEYSLDNVEDYGPVDSNELLKPFGIDMKTEGDERYIPLKELLEGLQAVFNGENFSYNDNEYEIHQNSIVKNGDTIYENALKEFDGRLYINLIYTDDILGMKLFIEDGPKPVDERDKIVLP